MNINNFESIILDVNEGTQIDPIDCTQYNTANSDNYDACLKFTFKDGATDVALLKEQQPPGSCNFKGHFDKVPGCQVASTGGCPSTNDEFFVRKIKDFRLTKFF